MFCVNDILYWLGIFLECWLIIINIMVRLFLKWFDLSGMVYDVLLLYFFFYFVNLL